MLNSYRVKTTREAERQARMQHLAPQMLELIRQLGRVFRQYEALHREKGTPEGTEKADKNAHIAVRCEEMVDFVQTGKAT
jgi:hypothetical protein